MYIDVLPGFVMKTREAQSSRKVRLGTGEKERTSGSWYAKARKTVVLMSDYRFL